MKQELNRSLNEIWQEQKDFNKNFVDYSKLDSKGVQSMTQKYALYLIDEVMELLKNISWKPHRNLPEQPISQSNIEEELIDIFKYWLSLCLVWNIEPTQFLNEFWRKSSVVRLRHQQEFIENLSTDGTSNIVIVDIDGVLANYRKSFQDFINARTEQKFDFMNSKEYSLSGYVTKELGFEKAMELEFDWRESGMAAECNVFYGAAEFTKNLEESGYKIVLLSSRPYGQHKRIMADTLYWLKKNEIKYHALFWADNKIEFVHKNFKEVKFVLEDEPGNIKSYMKAGLKVLMPVFSYNKDMEAIEPGKLKKFYSFEDLLDHNFNFDTLVTT